MDSGSAAQSVLGVLLMKKTLLTGIVALLLATGTAHATEDGCAVVLKTPDGFLNVRTEPNARSRILKRFKPGEIIGTDIVSEDRRWERTWFERKGGSFVRGWVRNRFILNVECEADNNQERFEQFERGERP